MKKITEIADKLGVKELELYGFNRDKETPCTFSDNQYAEKIS